jgi:hypothetical protein
MDEERYKVLLELRNQSSLEFDKLVVYLAAGGLGLTVAFTNDLVDLAIAQCKWLLLATWISFIITLVLNLVSQLTSTKSMDLEMESENSRSDFFDNVTNWLNILSILFLELGICFFFILTGLNLING